jgi:pantoate--beta-alanine ligase
METFTSKNLFRERLKSLKNQNKTIGFVPTMGALHKGHLSLIDCAKKENNITVASIFVNPTQFNERDDFKKYPRNIDKDLDILSRQGCDIAFTPSEEDMYPETDNRHFDFGTLQNVMEGAHRPGHFNGVAQIVSKFLEIIHPDKAYFGEKDFQQLTIIRELTRQMNMNTQIIGCPIIREDDGLAMSSRNKRLSKEERESATKISEILFKGKEMAEQKSVKNLKEWMKNELNKNPHINVEYIEIVNEKNLQPIHNWKDAKQIRTFAAAWVGNVRLIDNVKYYF